MTIKSTTDLTCAIYQDALNIRKAVFVKEQLVPENLEIDANESKTIHFVKYIKQQPVGTARLLPCPDKNFNLIQRVAVMKAARHQHIGSELIKAIVHYHLAHYPDQALQLGAQEHAIEFYEALGFQVIADEPAYLDAGMRHREMRLIVK